MTPRTAATHLLHLAGRVGTWARDVGNWLMETQLDEQVCRLSRQIGGDDDE